ncbi:hypothetical protein N781_12335 [Pontibacillus halophilus JSM 076056 = DSM 19796]|uniref:RNA-binding protein KhpA n=1 Tax=Pontibacillus halophilus JSM 076056 = DSM 19796 TaxID=1385510 RepID=A0A0A5GIV4_9BACI|nr:KH domain-containing protein [Pontibacillus halophilus]KGX93191.1 hypothetical protein N781_12335 [Pontibacillus halophilus JSM 076056 = DSM 19796]
MEALIETIVRPLVDYPEDIKITKQEEAQKIMYQLHLHQDDVGKVIGKQGRVAKSIRTLVYAAGSKSNKRIFLEIM